MGGGRRGPSVPIQSGGAVLPAPGAAPHAVVQEAPGAGRRRSALGLRDLAPLGTAGPSPLIPRYSARPEPAGGTILSMKRHLVAGFVVLVYVALGVAGAALRGGVDPAIAGAGSPSPTSSVAKLPATGDICPPGTGK